MEYSNDDINQAKLELVKEFANLDDKKAILKSPQIRDLYSKIRQLPESERGSFGSQVNMLKNEVESWLSEIEDKQQIKSPIDITAPIDVNISDENQPKLLSPELGSIHPLTYELNKIMDIYTNMGFSIVESRQIDDDYHMFETLNFPAEHPARDDYDTFMTEDGYIAPAHTSTMQNRVLKANKYKLDNNEPIAVVVPGRVFRNEDLDATHEHTFYQIEGVYVSKGVNVGNLIAVLKTFMSQYFGQELKAKIQPFYFPFTEPSFEFAIERPNSLKKGSTEADQWLELLGCGMINPNVLKMAGIDPNIYTGFAWGGGLERLVLMKYGIEDIRHFENAKIEFLRQFK
ncbi:phenylalanine--tRNA ligase subunit alpha [Candidatus Saccharibacteria bacterium]|nr:phenylalanine--tRNA ligase subunit alpha [Candidatus Saccharibacteria bacterium]